MNNIPRIFGKLRLIDCPRILVILLFGAGATISSSGIAKETSKLAKPSQAESSSKNSKSNLDKTKAKTNLLVSAISARKSRKDKPREELASLDKADPTGSVLDQVELDDLSKSNARIEKVDKLTIGATARVQESQSELLFEARVDTGAASCSMHCEEWEVDDEAESMEENVGKEIRVLISNDDEESHWVASRIEECVVVKTSEKRETRYKVPMTLRWNDFEKEVVVTLNNRGHMSYPLLLGRNFLEGDFVVDIEMGE